MSRSEQSNMPSSAIVRMAAVVAMLIASVMMMGCDGGLFGTGDGSDASLDSIATDMGIPDGITIDPVTDAPDSSVESEATDSVEESSDENSQQQILSFSNTLPSGLSSQTAPLPALKVINLTQVAINAATLSAIANDIGIDTLPGTASDWLPINVGESDIRLSTVTEGNQFAIISPLNSAEDSLTSIVLSGSFDSSDSVNTIEGSSIMVLALETRATVSDSAMAEIRLVRTAASSVNEPETQRPDQYLLTPDDNNSNGVELAFTTLTDTDAQIGSYQLIMPGNYTLSSNGDTPLMQPISLEANTVYTLIVTTEPQRPVFVEVDSRIPDSE